MRASHLSLLYHLGDISPTKSAQGVLKAQADVDARLAAIQATNSKLAAVYAQAQAAAATGREDLAPGLIRAAQELNRQLVIDHAAYQKQLAIAGVVGTIDQLNRQLATEQNPKLRDDIQKHIGAATAVLTNLTIVKMAIKAPSLETTQAVHGLGDLGGFPGDMFKAIGKAANDTGAFLAKNGQIVGAVVGGVAGGVAGAVVTIPTFVGAIPGAALGASIGGMIGKRIEDNYNAAHQPPPPPKPPASSGPTAQQQADAVAALAKALKERSAATSGGFTAASISDALSSPLVLGGALAAAIGISIYKKKQQRDGR